MSKISNVILMLEYLSTRKKYSIQELSDLLEMICSSKLFDLLNIEDEQTLFFIILSKLSLTD